MVEMCEKLATSRRSFGSCALTMTMPAKIVETNASKPTKTKMKPRSPDLALM